MLKGAGRWREGFPADGPAVFLCFLPCDFATAIAHVCVWIATAIAIIFVRISSPNPFLPLLITPWIREY